MSIRVNLLVIVKDTMRVLQNLPGVKVIEFDVECVDLSDFHLDFVEEYHWAILEDDSAISMSRMGDYTLVQMGDFVFRLIKIVK